MKKTFLLFLAILLIAAQIGFVNFFSLPFAMIDFALITFVFFLALSDSETVFWFLLFLGFGLDLLSPYRFGFFTLSYLLVFLIYQNFSRRLPLAKNPYFILPLLLLTSGLIFGWQAIFAKISFLNFSFSVLYTSLIGFLLFMFFNFIFKYDQEKSF